MGQVLRSVLSQESKDEGVGYRRGIITVVLLQHVLTE
jgi:hypothetical protein